MNLLYLLTLITAVVANRDVLWQEWKRLYKGNSNDDSRRAQWEHNLDTILQHNLRQDLGLESYTMGLNQFSDLSWDEFREQYLNDFDGQPEVQSMFGTLDDIIKSLAAPDEVDWRKQGLVTPVKIQGKCGSCWAFSTTGAVEGQYKKLTGKLVSFSEQQLVDCSRGEGNRACFGGLPWRAYSYIKKAGGLTTEEKYPYLGSAKRCHFNSSMAVAKVDGYKGLLWASEWLLKLMVANNGPSSVAINVQKDFQHYKSGIFVSKNSSRHIVNHAVLVVGYGRENKQDYWTVKNSWGPTWGEEGYVRMARNMNNMCGIANVATVPNVKTL